MSKERVSMYAYEIQMLTCGIPKEEHERFLNLPGCIGYNIGNASAFTVYIYYYFISKKARDEAFENIKKSCWNWGAFRTKEPVLYQIKGRLKEKMEMAEERVRMLCWGFGILWHREEETDKELDAALMDMSGFGGYDDQPVAWDGGPEARFYFYITEEFLAQARALAREMTAGKRVIFLKLREPVMFEFGGED